MHWRVVANPEAGHGRTRRLLPELRRALSESTLDTELSVSRSAEHAGALAREAFGRGWGVVSCGGDGSIADLAGPAVDTGGVLGIIPTGSGNDFARHLGFDTRRPLHAVEALEHGRFRTVDLGRVDDRWVTTVAGTGFDAEANRWANDVERLSGTALYVAAAMRTLCTYEPHRFRVTIDGSQPRDPDAWMIAVANTPAYGGGMRIAPDARIDDGVLDVAVVHGTVSRAGFLWAFPRVFRGTHLSHPAVEMLRAQTVTLESLDDNIRNDSAPMELWASGERVGTLPRVVTSVPGALRVVDPSTPSD